MSSLRAGPVAASAFRLEPSGRPPRTMTVPNDGGPGSASPSGSCGVPARLKSRSEFLRAAGGGRVHSRSFSLQVYRRNGEDAVAGSRVGLTVTKKVGHAVERNRIKRRLREALRMPDVAARSDHDYVLVARRDALTAPFASLLGELRRCFAEAGSGRSKPSRPRAPGSAGPRRGKGGPSAPRP